MYRDASSYGNSYQSGGTGTGSSDGGRHFAKLVSPTVSLLSEPSSNPSYLTNDPESGIGSSSAQYTSTGGFGSNVFGDSSGAGAGPASSNVWESRLGLRVDVLAALAYLGGPLAGEKFPHPRLITTYIDHAALVLLILETVNDYVRFHGMLLPQGISE